MNSQDLEHSKLASSTDTELDQLFDNAFKELRSLNNQELQIQLHSTPDPREVRVLFDAIANDLKPRKRNNNISQQVLTSADRKIDASSITQKTAATAKIVRLIETERKKRVAATKKRLQEQKADQQILLIPALGSRLCSGLIDLLAAILVDLTLVLIISLVLWPERLSSLSLQDTKASTIIILQGLALSCLPLASIGYSLFFLLRQSSTLGMHYTTITLADAQGYKPPTINLIVRALSTPVSFILFGFLTPLLGRRSLSDLLSNTRCIQEYSSLEEEPEESIEESDYQTSPKTL